MDCNDLILLAWHTGLVALSWFVGYFTARGIENRRRENKRHALLEALKAELHLLSTKEINNQKENLIAEVKINPYVGILIGRFRDEYIDWVLSSGVLDPARDKDLIKALVDLKGVFVNNNNAVYKRR